MRGKILCAKNVAMEGSGEQAFTKGREYDCSVSVTNNLLSFITVNDLGERHTIIVTRINSEDFEFFQEHFELRE